MVQRPQPRAYPGCDAPPRLSPLGVRMRRILALVLAILLAPAHARAAWLPRGNTIAEGNEFVAGASGPDRIVVAWTEVTGHSRVRAQAWTAEGDLALGWP